MTKMCKAYYIFQVYLVDVSQQVAKNADGYVICTKL